MPSLHPTDGQKIGKGPDHSIADSVLCRPKPPGSVVHLDLCYGAALHLCKGREEAVHAVEELQFLETLPLICLQGATGIDDFLLAQLIPHEVGYLRRNDPDPRILSLVSPSADYIELPYLFHKAWYIVGIILEVCIHRYHDITLDGLKPGIEGRGLTGVFFEADYPYLWILRGGRFQYLKAPITASVIHEDDFI